MHKEDGCAAAIGSLVITLTAGLVGWAIGVEHGRHNIRVEAVEHGAAEWVVDSSGESTFQWTTEIQSPTEPVPEE